MDEEQGSELQAQAIDVRDQTGDVAARESVRHVLRKRPGLLGSKDEPTIMTSRFFDYDGGRPRRRSTARTRCCARARTRSAAPIRVQEAGRRQAPLEAEEVSSRASTRGPGRAGKPAAAVEGRAEEMVYDESEAAIVYTGDVTIRQGDIQTKSPEATLDLTADGRGIETLVAGSPVEVGRGSGRAKGARGTYTPGRDRGPRGGQGGAGGPGAAGGGPFLDLPRGRR